MNKLKKITAPPRFSAADISGWRVSEIKDLSVSSQVTKLSDKLSKFRTEKKIMFELSPSEMQICQELVLSKGRDELIGLADVHGHYLNKTECYFNRSGLVVQTPSVEEVKQEIVPASPWVAPPKLVKEYPGIQLLVGMAITVLTREDGEIRVHYEAKPYQELAFTGVDATSLQGFGAVLVAFLGPFFKGRKHVGQGREFINELFQAIGALSKEEYVALQVALARGPFNHCFVWSRMSVIKDVRQKAKPGAVATVFSPVNSFTHSDPDSMFIDAVKPAYKSSFDDKSNSPTVVEIQKTTRIGKIVPFWMAAIPNSYKVPKSGRDLTPAKVHEYMTMCRAQRKTDEKGLSAWSSGFGACGNPTKVQLRLNKKLSIIMGQVYSKSHKRVVVVDDSTSDAGSLIAQLTRWILNNDSFKASMDITSWVFRVQRSDFNLLRQYPHRTTTSDTPVEGDCIIFFPNFSPTIASATEWAKVDRQCQESFADLLSPYQYLEERQKVKITFMIYSHVLTRTVFPPFNSADDKRDPSFNTFFVFTLGSAHNMMALMSTSVDVHFAASEGESPYQLSLAKGNPLTETTFFDMVCEHNARRSSFFLSPQYYFNAKLNLLRHIPGKTIDFVTGVTTDTIGIDVTSVVKDLDIELAKVANDRSVRYEYDSDDEDPGLPDGARYDDDRQPTDDDSQGEDTGQDGDDDADNVVKTEDKAKNDF